MRTGQENYSYQQLTQQKHFLLITN